MSEGPRAVFLSYASQDAAAVQRMAEALRAAGVEVWFDQNELVGGDAWDAKIRGQIKTCALFVPVISAATQARREGYFRIEWKLAAQRTHAMADGTPFLLPVVIDGTRDPEALVPAEFRAVQWTKLPSGETPAAFCERVRKLLGGETMGATVGGAICPDDGGRSMESGLKAPPAGTRGPRPRLVSAIIGFAAVVVALAFWQPWRVGPPASASVSGARSSPRTDSSEAWQLAERARKHFQGIFTRADLALAEELGRRAAELEPTLARAWAVRAGASACYLMRGFVAGEAAQERARDVQAFAAQALALDRDETEALIALGQLAMFQNAPSQAEALYRRVIAKEPENPFARRYLSIVLRTTGRAAEAIESMQDAVRRFPGDTLTHFDLAIAYAYGWNWPRAWEEADAALALGPFPGALMLKVRLAFQWKGDVGLMRDLLDQVDVTYRGEDDAVVWEMRWALWSRQPERVLEAAGSTARPYLEESFIFSSPKAWFTAQAYELAGKSGLARQQWQIAESVLRERIKVDPQNLDLRLKLAVTLARMGENEQATRELQPIESAWREQINADRAWDLASFYAASEDAARAVPLLREALHAGSGIAPLTVHHLKLDPWWDKIRRAPEFQALLANAPSPPSPVGATSASVGRPAGSRLSAANEKSVAVLSFANLSDDKDNEYFSDGISEELLNVLAKIPGLKVTARTSSFYFKGKQVPMADIAKQLGVAYVVEGSVRKSGTQVRITAQLIKAADGFHVWSDTFTRELKDIFAVQDEIARAIMDSVKVSVMGETKRLQATTTNFESYNLYLQGQAEYAKRGEAGLRLAAEKFEAALKLDPDYVPALVGLARAKVLLPNYASMSGAPVLALAAEATRAARRVLTLEPNHALAHATLGFTLMQHAWRWTEASAEFQRAVELAPADAEVANFAGDFYRLTLNFPRMIEREGRALELDPLSVANHWDLSSAYQLAGDYSRAITIGQTAIAMAPTIPDAYMSVVWAAGYGGQLEVLRQSIATARANLRANDGALLMLEAFAAIKLGQPDAARRILAAMAPLAEIGQASSAAIGYHHLLLGDDDTAARWLQKALELRDPMLVWPEVVDFNVVAANSKTRSLLERPGLKELYELRQRNARESKR